jgi:pre-mRNA-splicing factor ATP-dependent RNA helicase DHX15/PRP43
METRINPLSENEYSPHYFEVLDIVKELPICPYKSQILDAVENNKVLILTAGTGSGKTSQMPRFLLSLMTPPLDKFMVMTQPKKISAISAARRLAEELDVTLGAYVGYKVRFDKRVSSKTRIFQITDGMLLQEFANDPNLSNYSFILIDEAHERTINTDIILALLKVLVQTREDVRVIVMSATIDTVKFSKYFNNSPVISVPGMVQTITTEYLSKPTEDYFRDAVLKTIEICEGSIEGDVIIFIDGSDTAEKGCNIFNRDYQKANAICYTLYAQMAPQQQDKVKNENIPGKRKVIFSTNLAEASITISTAVFVIDCGWHKESSFDPHTRAHILDLKRISQASAKQRQGRVGRTSPGYVFRLYTEEEFLAFPMFNTPEINRSSMEESIIKIKKTQLDRGVAAEKNNLMFDFIDPPSRASVMGALEILTLTQIIDKNQNLTSMGDLVSKFPTDHDIARLIILSHKHSNSKDIIAIAAMLSVENIFARAPQELKEKARNIQREYFRYGSNKFPGDHYGLLNIFNEFKKKSSEQTRRDWAFNNFFNYRELDTAVKAYDQFNETIDKNKIKSSSTKVKNPETIGKSLLESYFTNIAFRRGGDYICVYGGNKAKLDGILNISKPELVLYTKLLSIKSQMKIQNCYEIKAEWLLDVSSYMFKKLNEMKKQ